MPHPSSLVHRLVVVVQSLGLLPAGGGVFVEEDPPNAAPPPPEPADVVLSLALAASSPCMPRAVATTAERSFGRSGTIIMFELLAISASSPTYFSARRCTIASWPPGSATAAAMARSPSAVACAARRVEAV